MHLVSISKFPPPCASQLLPAFYFFKTKKTYVWQHFLACIFMYPHLDPMSGFHPGSLNNCLRSSCFNIELSLPPSISCIHFASYVDFPHWPSTTSYVFFVSIWEFPLHKHFFACILSEHLNSPHPVPGRRKNVPVQKKKAPRSKNAQPNVLSTYNKGVPPPPHGGKVHEAGARVQKKDTEFRNNSFGCPKKNSPGPTQIHAGPTKYPHRSQKKGAHVQKTCIPKKTPVLNIPAGCLSNPRFQRLQCSH